MPEAQIDTQSPSKRPKAGLIGAFVTANEISVQVLYAQCRENFAKVYPRTYPVYKLKVHLFVTMKNFLTLMERWI